MQIIRPIATGPHSIFDLMSVKSFFKRLTKRPITGFNDNESVTKLQPKKDQGTHRSVSRKARREHTGEIHTDDGTSAPISIERGTLNRRDRDKDSTTMDSHNRLITTTSVKLAQRNKRMSINSESHRHIIREVKSLLLNVKTSLR